MGTIRGISYPFAIDVLDGRAEAGSSAGKINGIRDEVTDLTRIAGYGYADEACFEERGHSDMKNY